MSNLSAEDRDQISAVGSRYLWFALVSISAIVLAWPVAPSPTDPLPVQSVHAVQNLSLFVASLFLWTIVFGGLLILVRGNAWERLALCLIFSLVFVVFWGPLTNPWGNSGDSAWLMGHVKRLQETGRIPPGGHSTLTYFDFPGIQLVLLSLRQVTGIELYQVSRVYLAASTFVLILGMYAVFLNLTGTSHNSALAVILAIVSSRVLGVVTNQFHPINLATIYIAIFVLLMATGSSSWRFGERGVILATAVLTVAATIEYMFTPVFFSLVLLAVFLLRPASDSSRRTALASAIFSLVVFLTWEVFLTVHNFPTTVRELPAGIKGLVDGSWLIPTRRVLSANLGPSYPLWGTAAKLFWWASVFGLGTILMVRQLFRVKSIDNLGKIKVAVFSGIVITAGLGSLVGGAVGVIHGGLSRYIWVAPFVLAPAVVQALTGSKARTFSRGFALAAILILPPTFLTNGDIFSANRTYHSEVAALEFVHSLYDNGKSLVLYSIPSMPAAVFLYIPDARFAGGAYVYGDATEAQAWNGLLKLVQDFRGSDSGEDRLALVSIKTRKDYELRLGISPGHPNWRSLTQKLSQMNLIYDTDALALYSRRSASSNDLEP